MLETILDNMMAEISEAYVWAKNVQITKANALWVVLATMCFAGFCSSDFFVLYAREVLDRGLTASEFWMLTAMNAFAVTGFLITGNQTIKKTDKNN